MNNKSAKDIRKAFLTFFSEKGHIELPSSSLIPKEDTTVLLTTAGMQQIMPYFLQTKEPPARRICTIQKCFRTVDIDEVGDAHHNTFFEMLGNFSVGDYFKVEVIPWAYEFLTERLCIPSEKLWVTIHPNETVADKVWQDVGIPPHRIVIDEGNFWGPPGESGPCGPCSEIYFDFGQEASTLTDKDAISNPTTDDGRFLEIWNLVFMELFQDKDGSRTPLPAQNIDTGMGFERIVRVMQEKDSSYDTDIFSPIFSIIAQQFPEKSLDDPLTVRSFRIIADHTRSAAFLASELIAPSNVGRGYIMRRIIRRAVRAGFLLQKGEHHPFLRPVIESVIKQYREYYPEFITHYDEIFRIITHEEEHFNTAIEKGMYQLNKILEKNPSGISGHDAFVLYDTYGFPLELTQEIAAEHGVVVDKKGFEREMEEQRERSRRGSQFSVQSDTEVFQEIFDKYGETAFLGYDELETTARIVGLVVNKEKVTSARHGQEVELVLDKTTFYARSGGQAGDSGEIMTNEGKVKITDTRAVGGSIVHIGHVIDGVITTGQEARAVVDKENRTKTARHHTATHLLHKALRELLGEAVKQAGSSVTSKGLRFDFTFPRKITREELDTLEEMINEKIKQGLNVDICCISLDEARELGAMALFDGKYGEKVRMVSLGTWSRELCGGTHVRNTKEIGRVRITKEESVGGGIRRIRAVAEV